MDSAGPELAQLLDGLAAAADPSRLRLLAICAQGEWTVSELVQVLGQSQPRISRHLKILAEAGLLDRFREGSWVFYRRAQDGDGARLARSICRLLPAEDGVLQLDRRRLEVVRAARRRAAEAWFDHHAKAWDEERELGPAETAAIEQALTHLFEGVSTPSLLDIGTGTGRVLQLLASRIGYGLGVDVAQDMLKIARANLDRREARNCQVRHGDMYQLPLPDASFSAVTFHQVLHFADDPFAALAEARRVLAPGGRIVVIDLARHEREDLREARQHRRLGFTDPEMTGWLEELGLQVEPSVQVPGGDLTVVLWSARLADAQVLPFPPHGRSEALA
ncbi:MAG TPA: metalloregulator ArsR/SmtB family transcription factor [Geminicoccus sp.]|uniref:ArsR/SmtB family transcription factor n=1 Tax=Geminicoccus sp. TaxID=2024832 RepID=UPI002C6E1633|nr:metalloregulator ArsR/SmtB family transcription factor [Geminicoccus sp.]HWL70348.1 metalloregulator ArsR/SmtB family transcription factor [Geminicoccus sp.]